MTSEGDIRKLLLRFLLGELPAEEAETFEQSLLADEEFADRVAEARYDLLDAFAADEMDASMRRRVEKALLQSPGDSAGLAVAQRLQKARISDANRLSQPKRRRSFAQKRVWIPVAAAVTLAIAGGLYIHHGRGRSSASLAEIRNRQTATASGQTEQAFVLLLEPQVMRGAGQPRTVVLPPQTSSVEVQLVLGRQESFGPYQVVLKSGQGQQIAAFKKLRPRDLGQTRYLQITVATRLVPAGNYRFEVYLQGTSVHPIHSYTVSIAPMQTPRK